MTPLELRSAIIAEVREKVSVLQENCQAHGGRFDKGEIRRVAIKSPVVLIACLGLLGAESDGCGEVDAVFQWGAFVVTTDKPQLPRDAGALAIVTALANIIPGNRWGAAASEPERIRGDNLFSGQLEGAGVALWAITWQQKLTLGGLEEATLDDFLVFHADYDLAPPDGQIDAVDDVQIDAVDDVQLPQ